MKKSSKSKLRQLKNIHYTASLAAFIVAFGAIGIILEFTGHAATQTGVKITSGYSGFCLDDLKNGTGVGNEVDLYTCNTAKAQLWSTDTSTNQISINSLCMGLNQNNTASGTRVVLRPCSVGSTATWGQETNGTLVDLGAGNQCLTAASANNNVQLTITPCSSGPPKGQIWAGGPKAPAPAPTPTPTPTPNPTPTPTPTPTPAPKPTPAPVTQRSTSSSTPLTVTNTFAPPTTAPNLNDTPTDTSTSDTTLGLGDTQATPTNISSVPPVISNFSISHITASSVLLKWHSNVASSYVIKYGLSPNHLTTSTVLTTNQTNISVTLNHLPSGKHIYASISPNNDGTYGSMKQVDFKTSAHTIVTPIVLSLLFLLIIIVMLIKLIGRKPVRSAHSNELPLPDAPVFPQEDQAAYNNRVNWWLPEDRRQEGVHGGKKSDDVPDMYEEGRQRLEEEEREHKLPKN